MNCFGAIFVKQLRGAQLYDNEAFKKHYEQLNPSRYSRRVAWTDQNVAGVSLECVLENYV